MNQEKTELQQAKAHVQAYVSNHLELAKLEAAERSAKVAASIAVSLLRVILLLIVVGFLSFSAAFYLSDLLGAYHFGFLTVGGFYLLVLIAYVTVGKSVVHRMYTNSIINKIFKNYD